jgi:protease secretion system membrane fusion protein
MSNQKLGAAEKNATDDSMRQISHVLQSPAPLLDDSLSALRADMRLGWWVLLAGALFFMVWASFVPLQEGVPSQATVVIETKRKSVQHMQGGIVSDVMVKEGQWVEQGQELLRLDSAQTKAMYETAKQSLAALRENLVAQQAIYTGLVQAEKHRRDQRAALEKEMTGLRQVVQEGFAPRVQLYQLERSISDLDAMLVELKSNQQKTRQSILEIEHQIQAAQMKQVAAQSDLARVSIFAPVKGQVVGMNVQSSGAVIQPAEKIMDIVPKDELLVIEAKINPQYVDRLRVGSQADVRFSSFANTPLLVVDANLLSFSGDVLVDAQTHQNYYLARLAISEKGLKQLDGKPLHAGMGVEVVLHVGERTLLQYLLHPLTKRLAASMKEQ